MTGKNTLVLAAVTCIAVATPAVSKPKWDQAANIAEAGTHLGQLQRREGAQGVLKFLEACYKTHSLASEYSSALEACIAQDYIFTQALAVIYSRIPTAERARLNIPEPLQLANSMGKRIDGAFAQYKISKSEAQAFKKLVDKHGFPAFNKIAFPKSESGENAASPPSSEKK